MEIHGSSLNISILRPSPQTAGKFDVDLKQRHNVSTAVNPGRNVSQRVNGTSAAIGKTFDYAGLTQFATTLENNNQSLDFRKLNAINAYISQSTMPLLEQRAQMLAGIDLYV